MDRIVTCILVVCMTSVFSWYELYAQDSSFPEMSGVHRCWTLDDCIGYAMEHNIEMKRQELVPEDKRVSLSDARWSYVPSFFAGSGYSLSAGRVLDETTYDFLENETVGSSSLSISGSIEIFAGFKKHHELQRAKLLLKAALQDFESARYDLRANVTAAFLEVLCAREGITEAEQIVSMLELQRDKVRLKVETGKVTEADLLQITAQVYSAQNDVLTAKGVYDMARLELCQLLEIDEFSNFEADTSAVDSIPVLIPIITDSIAEAVSWRPEIKSAELGVELARKGLQIARSSCWPSIRLAAGYGTSHSDARQYILQNPDGSFRYENYPFFQQYADNASTYVSVSLNIPILHGLSARNSIRKSKTALKDAEYSLVRVRKGTVKEYKKAEIDARVAYERFLVTQRQVKAAEEAARQIMVKYNNGSVDIITLSTAVSELASARYQMLSAKYECTFKRKILDLLIK